jgi:hypothetical protein
MAASREGTRIGHSAVGQRSRERRRRNPTPPSSTTTRARLRYRYAAGDPRISIGSGTAASFPIRVSASLRIPRFASS